MIRTRLTDRMLLCLERAADHLRCDADVLEADGMPDQRQRGRDLRRASAWLQRYIDAKRENRG